MYKYLTYLPDTLKNRKNYPVLFFLHGAPQRSENFEKLKNVELPVLLEKKELNIPVLTVAPLCPEGQMWDAKELDNVYYEVKKEYNIDERKIYITGFSMGGFGSLKWVKDSEINFAAIVAVCSGGSVFLADYLKEVPIWFWHGTNDTIIEFEKTFNLYNKLKSIGADVKLTALENEGHKIWDKVYRQQEIYDWMLSHQSKI